jgi:uncharacterized membrane protein YkoI
MKSILAAAVTVALTAPLAQAQHHDGEHHGGSLTTCLELATAIRPGEFAKVEYLTVSDENVEVYEIEVVTEKGTWEFECDAHHARIVEIEQEVDSVDHPLFKRSMKVSEEQARKTVLNLYPGTIDEVEYEIEVDGKASYEIDVVDEYGVEWKVEIDATSGEIVEVQIEAWEIGMEDKD